MKSNVNLHIVIEHEQNLPAGGAEGIAALIRDHLLQVLPATTAMVKVQSAAIHGMVPMVIEATHNG